jgi:hypothetical protein
MKPLPDFASVVAMAIEKSGRPDGTVNSSEVAGQVSLYVYGTIREMFSKTGLDGDEIAMVMGRPDFSADLLSDYLSTCGVAGPVINDRLAELLINDVPGELGVKIAHELI